MHGKKFLIEHELLNGVHEFMGSKRRLFPVKLARDETSAFAV